MPWEGPTLVPVRRGEKRKTERRAKEFISEVEAIEKKKKPNLNYDQPVSLDALVLVQRVLGSLSISPRCA